MNVIRGLKSCFSLMGRFKYMYWITLVLDVGLSFLGDMLIALVNRDVVNSVTSMDLASFKAAIFIGIAAIAVFLASVLSRFFNMRSIRYIMYDMRRDLFRHMEFLPVEYYDKNHSADSIFRLNSNVENMKQAYTNHCPNFMTAIVGGAASCVFILAMDLRIGLLSLITCALTVIINVKYAASLRELGGRIQRSESAVRSGRGIQSNKTVRFGRSRRRQIRARELRDRRAQDKEDLEDRNAQQYQQPAQLFKQLRPDRDRRGHGGYGHDRLRNRLRHPDRAEQRQQYAAEFRDFVGHDAGVGRGGRYNPRGLGYGQGIRRRNREHGKRKPGRLHRI